MKKRIVSLIMVAAMAASLVVGCGSKDASSGEKTSSEGKVLNVQCWNDEFQRRVTDHYPGYEKVDETTGKIGDVTVNWIITPNKDNAYQDNLDRLLEAQESAEADEKVDIFLVEADYALKYIDTDYAMPVADLGITEEDTAEQFEYTKEIVTDSNGQLKGLSWQGCPGIMFYNRDIATEVLGTDDPDAVQEAVKDWDTFTATADKVKAAGYNMTSSVNDTYRVYSNNVTSKWVEDGKVNIDENINKWVADSKKMVDLGETGTHELWSDDWAKGMFEDTAVFCYFGPAWLINFSMHCDEEGSVGYAGKWGGCVGPQSFFWGGTWICAATGTDNADLIKDIMLKLTCDPEIMKEIVVDDDDFVNNKAAMEEMAKSDYSSEILGGQNPLPMYIEGAEKIDLAYLSPYDQGCNEEMQNSMKNYFDGKATEDEALELFYKAVGEKYPELETGE